MAPTRSGWVNEATLITAAACEPAGAVLCSHTTTELNACPAAVACNTMPPHAPPAGFSVITLFVIVTTRSAYTVSVVPIAGTVSEDKVCSNTLPSNVVLCVALMSKKQFGDPDAGSRRIYESVVEPPQVTSSSSDLRTKHPSKEAQAGAP